ncbi:putative quinol monooxygenase [Glycomyces terrestris]|uniref:Antibiotic biosynthesis monooxygenase n=1 Tax=Glycomyces terrestris TaxID=2493553 RepID=A0A426UVJ4_9ACTN|nr:putative quinol monooxygenase [Glycomyces terrestris]RRR98342.1 antibiotic biosynthesis monooxygenase [Glycomyces terrestris]
MITVHAYVWARPEHADAYRAGLTALQESTLAHDPGCLAYACWESLTEPGAFVCVEEWTDRAALDAHLAAPHHTAGSAALDAYRARPADVRVFESRPIDL